MANVDIKIDDDYIKASAKLLQKKSEDLQNGVDNYLSILDGILSDAIMEGETADALNSFISYAKTLAGIIKSVGEECKVLCENFLQEVDIADSELY